MESNLLPETADSPEHLLELLAGDTIHLCQDGDLNLEVLEDEHKTCSKFRVSSHAMRLASPVWRAMLSPPFDTKEDNLGVWVKSFPEDNVLSFFLILLASHLKFAELPKELDFEDLVNLCVFCDKYDCISVINPWLSGWMAPYMNSVAQPGYEGWCTIAWVLGDEAVFKRALDSLMLSCTCQAEDSSQCMNANGDLIELELPIGLNGQFPTQ